MKSCVAHHFVARLFVAGIVLAIAIIAPTELSGDDQLDLPRDTEGSPLPPQDALKRVTVPDGFKVTLFAHEPDIRQPIAMTFDDRGRLWVCECYSYPDFKVKNRDRVVILEDTDGDGRHDKRTIFWDKGNSLTGIEYGYGGIWVCCAPHLLFIPDKNGDDVPDSEPVVELDGWTTEAKHNVFNGLKWGPDGWLYGCHGILASSRVGRPGTPNDKRVPLNCCIWRYHPTRKTFEVVCHGTTNPWGIDFNEYGEGFFTNCVIDHAFHMIPGAHYKRMYGQDMNPYVYELMEAASDHLHWGGGHWTESRTGEQHDAPGGGHAHSGTLIYLGDNFPKEYYGTLFTCNIHGNRVNNDSLERKGSGWVARHRPDFFKANDPFFRGVALAMDPDGGMYIADWSDTGECHDYEQVHRNSGRIYKVVHGNPKRSLLLTAGHVRRDFAYQYSKGENLTIERDSLLVVKDQPTTTETETNEVTAFLWTLNAIGGVPAERLHQFASVSNDVVAPMSIRLLNDGRDFVDSDIEVLNRIAKSSRSQRIRLTLASALHGMNVADRLLLASSLILHEKDDSDRDIPLLLWYGIEPCVPIDPKRVLDLALKSKLSKPRKYIVRRLCEPDLRKDNLVAVVAAIAVSEDVSADASMLEGMSEAFRGLKDQPLPEGWEQLTVKIAKNGDAKSLELVRTLSLIFGDPAAIKQLRITLDDTNAKIADRIAAIELLSERKVEGLVPLLVKLIDEPALRVAALRGLAAYDDASIPVEIIKRYSKLEETDRIEAINTLASRVSFAKALLSAMETKQIPARDFSPFHARQLAALRDGEIDERQAKVWGRAKPVAEDKTRLKAMIASTLPDEIIAQADVRAGRAVFTRMCGACHSLFGEGAKIGPELTGAQRANLDYVLENLIDPNALIGKNYQMTLVTLTDGRVVSGVIDGENEAIVTLKTTSGKMTIPRSDIEDVTTSAVSMMPEGQLEKLQYEELRDLVGYLRSPQQVPLPDEPAEKRK